MISPQFISRFRALTVGVVVACLLGLPANAVGETKIYAGTATKTLANAPGVSPTVYITSRSLEHSAVGEAGRRVILDYDVPVEMTSTITLHPVGALLDTWMGIVVYLCSYTGGTITYAGATYSNLLFYVWHLAPYDSVETYAYGAKWHREYLETLIGGKPKAYDPSDELVDADTYQQTYTHSLVGLQDAGWALQEPDWPLPLGTVTSNFTGAAAYNRIVSYGEVIPPTVSYADATATSATSILRAWDHTADYWSSFGFYDGFAPVAKLDSTSTAVATLRKLQYKLVPTIDTPANISWAEVFTPIDPTQPKDYNYKNWVIPSGATESQVYTIDPLGIDPNDVDASHRHPTQDGTYEVLVLEGNLAVDANRDGQIKLVTEDASDQTSAGKPFRFWLNDDFDRTHTVDGNDSEEDDLQTSPNGKVDWENNYIPSKRDLEDFARLQISTAGLNDSFKNGQLYLGLKWTNITGPPAIKLYKHVETDGGLKYLTDDTIAQQQINAAYAIADIRDTATQPQNATRVVIEGTDVFVLPTSLFSGLSEAQPKTYLLFEGCKPGQGQLQLVILKKEGADYTEIGNGPGVWMDLKKIGDMYEHWSVGNTSGGVPDSIAARIPSLTGSSTVFKYDNGNPSPEDRKYILLVHGWNMQQWEKERFAETAYKRLYWQGYKGRFGLFSWPTTNDFSGTIKDAIIDTTNYDRGEWSAWRSATPLRQLLQTLNGAYSGELYVLAHSMGNVVVGESLRLQQQFYSGQVAKVYVASQAALPVHCYDGSRTADLQVDPKAVQVAEPYPQTPNIYPNWLSANSAAVGKRVNFFNVNDFALWVDAWQLNQVFKPDERDQPDQPWYYQYVQNENYPLGHWYKSQPPTTNVDLTLGSAADVRDRYEIMAFAAESRSKALGATSDITTFAQRVDLQSLWPTDTGLKGSSGLNYSAHKWHSAEFRSTNMRQGGYWKKLLGVSGFELITEP